MFFSKYAFIGAICFILGSVTMLTLALSMNDQLEKSEEQVYGLMYQVNNLRMELDNKNSSCELLRLKQVDIYEEGVDDILQDSSVNENKEDDKCIAVFMDCMKLKVAGDLTPKSCKDEYNKCYNLDTGGEIK